MKRVAILVAGTRGAAFYSQIAVLAAAIRRIRWHHWRPSIHACLGPAEREAPTDACWAPYLHDVEIVDVDAAAHAALGNWAQSDDALVRAPANADVLVCLDADTLPVASFEDVLDSVAAGDLVAGVMAHYPPPGIPSPEDWLRVANGLVTAPLAFEHSYSLVGHDVPAKRAAPFYVNGGVMFFARDAFDRFVPVYLGIRKVVTDRIVDEAFSGQVASTLAIAALEIRTSSLPMRYNFPNDPVAAALHADEADHVVIHHYLRTGRFDRHRIFTSADEFARLLEMPLEGPDANFREGVLHVLGSRYPFTEAR